MHCAIANYIITTCHLCFANFFLLGLHILVYSGQDLYIYSTLLLISPFYLYVRHESAYLFAIGRVAHQFT